jgi:2-keto-3-deoxy-6-phosphogluconate aldolase
VLGEHKLARLARLLERATVTVAVDDPGVLPGLDVTGGIEPDGVRPWLDAGALAVGLGSNLGPAGTVEAAEVERRCRAALAAAS